MTKLRLSPGSADLVPEGSSGTALDRRACFERLATTDRGQIAISTGALPAIVSVRYAIDGEQIVFPVGGDDVWRATDGHIVAFHADGVDDLRHTWTVGVVGRARHELEHGERLVVLTTDRVSGHQER